MSSEWVVVARIAKARGIKGEVAADPLTEREDRFEELHGTLFRPGSDEPVRDVQVENSWRQGNRVILKFCGIDNMSEAETLGGLELRVPLSERAPVGDGEFYQDDLIGCAVVEPDGTNVGSVTAVQNYGGPDLLAVKTPEGRELLIPFVRAICTGIDVEHKRIVAALPEGLKEL